MPTQLTYKLNSGAEIPAIGLGTWRSAPHEVEEAVKYAIDEVGYRHVDGAWGYGNETEVGNALKQCKTPRSEIFVTTKLWGTYHTRVAQGIEDSLNKLGVEYVDLYLMHWPIPLPPAQENIPLLSDGRRHLLDEKEWSFVDTWKEMEKLVKQGKCKAIGMSNSSIPYLQRIIDECKIVPAVNQVESHPLLPQDDLLQFCQEHGIIFEAYSPLGSLDSPLLTDPDLEKIAKKFTPSLAVQDLLAVARGAVVLPKSVTPSRIKENFKIVQLLQEDVSFLSTYAERSGGPKRLVYPPWGRNLGFPDGFAEKTG